MKYSNLNYYFFTHLKNIWATKEDPKRHTWILSTWEAEKDKTNSQPQTQPDHKVQEGKL